MLQAIGFAAGPILLVFVQPDVGTAMVYAVALAGVLFVAGTRWTHLAALASGALVLILAVLWLLPSAGVHVLKPYQQARLTHFTNPSSDPSASTYNVRESINAVAGGGSFLTFPSLIFAGILPVQAISRDPGRGSPDKALRQGNLKLRRAIEDHAQSVVIFAKIGIFHDLLHISLRQCKLINIPVVINIPVLPHPHPLSF